MHFSIFTLYYNFQVQRLELSLVPSEDTIPSQHMIHPNVPYLSLKDRYNSRNKKRLGTSLSSAKAWKIVLLIQNGTVSYVDEENSGQNIYLDMLHNGNQIVLGRHHLEMTIITPLLRHKCKEQVRNIRLIHFCVKKLLVLYISN